MKRALCPLDALAPDATARFVLVYMFSIWYGWQVNRYAYIPDGNCTSALSS